MVKKEHGFAAAVAVVLGALALALPAAADNGAPKWKAWTYNASGQAFSGSVPAGSPGLATVPVPATPDLALLVTDHGAYKGTLLGDLTGKTITATVSSSGGPFTYYGQPDACGRPADVRLYFQTKSPGSFAETDYWWSNPASAPLDGTSTHYTVSVPLNPAVWSDYYGHFGTTFPAEFAAAVKNVVSIGLSFGGGCFFENGVGAPTGGTFTLWSFSAS